LHLKAKKKKFANLDKASKEGFKIPNIEKCLSGKKKTYKVFKWTWEANKLK